MIARAEVGPEARSPVRARWRARIALAAAMSFLVAVGVVIWGESMDAEQLEVSDPTGDEIAAFADTRMFFAHQSVGSNVLGGLAALAPELHVVDAAESVGGVEGIVVHAYVGVNGDPLSKLDDFATMIDGGAADGIDIALLKFCYVDVDAGTDVDAILEAYTSQIAAAQARHPATTFLYATVPLVTDRDLRATVKSWLGRDAGMGPEDNAARQRFNEELRDRVAATGRLFDIAAVEAAMDQSPTTRTREGETFYVLHEAYAADRGHLNDLGARAAAAELVRVVAAARP
ncbi:hypothetical protein [Microbacterium aurum]